MEGQQRLNLVVFSGDLDRALAAFILSTTAASMGMEVTMFFTFWGLNVVKKNDGPIKSKGLMRRMLNWMNRGGEKRLKMSQFHMMGMGTSMMKKLMKDANIPSLAQMISMCKQMGVKMVVCTTTLGMMGVSEDAFIPEIDGFAGAATFLGQASQPGVTLFI